MALIEVHQNFVRILDLFRSVHSSISEYMKQIVLKFAAIILLYLTITPFLFVIWTSLWTGEPGSLDGAFTLQHYIDMYSNPDVYLLFLNTLFITVGMFAVSMTGGVTLAWLIGRTDIPTKGYLELTILAPYAIPSFIYALMYIFAFSPSAGLVNHYWMAWTGSGSPLVSIYSVWGIFFVMGIDAVTTVYLILIPALRNMDPKLEESSRLHGASMFQTIRQISLPVVVPALASAAIIVIIRGIGSFSAVAIIGIRFGFDVFATEIWKVTTQQFPPEYGYASALSLTLLIITGFLIVIYRRITKRKEDYMVVTGEGYRPANWELGKWKWIICGIIWPIMIMVWIIPISIVFAASFQPLWKGEFNLAEFTLMHWQDVLTGQRFVKNLTNTLIIAIAVAIVGTILITLAAYYTERTEYPFRGVLDFFLLTPMAFPGIVMGTSVLFTYLWFYNAIGISILGTLTIIIIGVLTLDLPITSRIAAGNIVQIHSELEEIARLSGATWLEQMKDIFLPLYKSTLGILVFYWGIGATKSLTVPLMVYVSSTEPISVFIFGQWIFNANFEEVAVISGIFMIFMVCILGFLKIFNVKFYEMV